jgi:hypothetical protein
MAKLKLYAVHDAKAGTYMMPFPMLTDQLAMRSFQQGCLDQSTPMAQYPLDHSLSRIGTYDDETGKLESESPYQLQTAIQAIKQVEDIQQEVAIAKGQKPDE